MKIDMSLIESIEIIDKPGGKKSLRIGYTKRAPLRQRVDGRIKNLWNRPMVRTVAIAIVAAVVFNLALKLLG